MRERMRAPRPRQTNQRAAASPPRACPHLRSRRVRRRGVEAAACAVLVAGAVAGLALLALEPDAGPPPGTTRSAPASEGSPAGGGRASLLARAAPGAEGAGAGARLAGPGTGAVGAEAVAPGTVAAEVGRGGGDGARGAPLGAAGPGAATPGAAAGAAAGPKAADGPAKAARARGRLAGVVVAEAGARLPAAGVVVVARPKRGAAARLDADPFGRFAGEVEAGAWTLSAEAEGLASTRVTVEVAGEAEAVVEGLALVPARQELVGAVLAADGAPVAGARVVVERGGRTPARRRAEAGPDGTFRAEGLPEGLYTLRAEAEGFVTATARGVAVAGGTTRAPTLRLQVAGRLAGGVRGGDGAPAAGARVQVLRGGRALANARADRAGAYAVAGLADGPVDVLATSADGALVARGSAVVAAGTLAVLDLALAAPPLLVGRVVGLDGAPRPRARVEARAADGRGRDRTATATTDAEGRFHFARLTPGRWTVSLPRRGAPPAARVAVEVPGAGADVRCDLVARDGAVLRGVVTGPDGRPLARALVAAVVGGRERSRTRTDAQGRFTVVGLAGGEVRLLARGPGDALVGHADVTARADALLDGLALVARPPARALGQVLDPDGRPLPGVAVALRGQSVRRGARTDDAGRFDLGPLYDGAYRLAVDAGDLALLARRRGVAAVTAAPVEVAVDGGRDVRCALQALDLPVRE